MRASSSPTGHISFADGRAADTRSSFAATERRRAAASAEGKPFDEQNRSPSRRPFRPQTSRTLAVLPLVGAVLGVVVFAGVVGGFLVATSANASYSPAALVFLAFLGGFFSGRFLRRLSAAADVLFAAEAPSSTGERERGRERQR